MACCLRGQRTSRGKTRVAAPPGFIRVLISRMLSASPGPPTSLRAGGPQAEQWAGPSGVGTVPCLSVHAPPELAGPQMLIPECRQWPQGPQPRGPTPHLCRPPQLPCTTCDTPQADLTGTSTTRPGGVLEPLPRTRALQELAAGCLWGPRALPCSLHCVLQRCWLLTCMVTFSPTRLPPGLPSGPPVTRHPSSCPCGDRAFCETVSGLIPSYAGIPAWPCRPFWGLTPAALLHVLEPSPAAPLLASLTSLQVLLLPPQVLERPGLLAECGDKSSEGPPAPGPTCRSHRATEALCLLLM